MTMEGRLLGLITVDDQTRMIVSPRVQGEAPPLLHRIGLMEIAGQALHLPRRFHPDRTALAWHRNSVFDGSRG